MHSKKHYLQPFKDVDEKSMNDVGGSSRVTNFNPNKRSPANFSILHYTQLLIT